jgi:beta-glucanase (GH16 family)
MRLAVLFVTIALSSPAQNSSGWQLVWSDEFNAAANTAPDPAKWNFDLGGGGWGNGELETYTNATANIFQDGQGHLVIRAIRDAAGQFTSARIRTGLADSSGKDHVNLSWQYGRIEARIKLPFGPGVWPAFWLLGSDFSTISWPFCGEIDILENFGSKIDDASTIHSTLHGPPQNSNFAGTGLSSTYKLPGGQKLTDDFHLFAVETAPDSIAFSVDGVVFKRFTPASLPPNAQWVFNKPFFILFNLAVGGPNTFLGSPAPGTPFPQDMAIDYVRVYRQAPVASSAPVIFPGGVVNAASGLGSIAPGALASVYGGNLSDAVYAGLFANGAFATATGSGVAVNVNGVNAPLTYVSPSQIDFQVPWATELAPGAVNVAVTRAGAVSNAEPVTLTSVAPSIFVTQCAGSNCTAWGNGFGPKDQPVPDGSPYTAAAATANPCTLSIGGAPVPVSYCGAAPGQLIEQLNFTYSGPLPALANLNIAGAVGTFQIPSAAQ